VNRDRSDILVFDLTTNVNKSAIKTKRTSKNCKTNEKEMKLCHPENSRKVLDKII
jgi:hypothetical protein